MLKFKSIIIDISTIEILIALLAAFIIGLSKSGIKGIFVLVVTLMAFVFGGKTSTGIIVPLLIVGDIMAVSYYKRHANWKILWKFLPWMVIGVLLGVVVGKDLPEQIFLNAMAVIIIVGALLMFIWEKRNDLALFNNPIFRISMGLCAGLTTMIGNLAGGFSNIYFLSTRIPKNSFIGTAAWLYMIINLVKLPFHIFVWETVNVNSLRNDLFLLPAVLLGFYCGVRIVKLFGERFFRKFILVATAFGALLLFLK